MRPQGDDETENGPRADAPRVPNPDSYGYPAGYQGYPSTPRYPDAPGYPPGGYPGAGQAPQPSVHRRFGAIGVVPWTFAQTVVGVAITLVPWVMFLVAGLLVGGSVSSGGGVRVRLTPLEDLIAAIGTLVLTTVIEAAFLIAPLYLAIRTRAPGAPLSDAFRALGFRRAPLGLSLGLIAGGFVLTLAIELIYGLIVQLTRLNLQTNVDVLNAQARYMPLVVVATLIGAVVVAPFCEETFFRGFALAGFLRGMGIWPAVILSAVLFTIAHGDVGSSVPILALGLVLAYARWRTGSIWPGIALHIANNSLAALVIIGGLIHP